jgi:hypothetical protein
MVIEANTQDLMFHVKHLLVPVTIQRCHSGGYAWSGPTGPSRGGFKSVPEAQTDALAVLDAGDSPVRVKWDLR